MQSINTTHQQCWDDIPWLVNGRLGEAEQERVMMHVAGCAECREELQQQRELHARLRDTAGDGEAPQAAFDKLLARIDAEPQEATSSSGPGVAAPASNERRWWVAAMVAQGVAVVVLLAALLVPKQPAEYFTLSAPDAASRGSIRVVFAPDAPLTRVNSVLREIEAEIVAGPSEAGVYTIAIVASDPSAAIAVLRRQREVLFAESTAAAGAARR